MVCRPTIARYIFTACSSSKGHGVSACSPRLSLGCTLTRLLAEVAGALMLNKQAAVQEGHRQIGWNKQWDYSVLSQLYECDAGERRGRDLFQCVADAVHGAVAAHRRRVGGEVAANELQLGRKRYSAAREVHAGLRAGRCRRGLCLRIICARADAAWKSVCQGTCALRCSCSAAQPGQPAQHRAERQTGPPTLFR